LYHIDSDFYRISEKKSADLKLQKAKPKYRSPFWKENILDLPLCLFYNGRAFFPVIHYATAISQRKFGLTEFQSGLLLSLKWIADFLSGNANVSFTQRKKHKQLRIILGFVANVPQFLCFMIYLGWNTDCQHSFITLAKCSSSLSPILLR
jgi:hypothetical protein